MITNVEYMQIVNEFYDLSDYQTKRNILFCNEATKTSNIEHITNNLYNQIRADVTAIDFGSIPKSKGIVSRIDGYTNLIDCIQTIHDLLVEYNEDTRLVDEISTAIHNLQVRERIISKAFALDIEFPQIVYNSMLMACISSISLMITSSIEFIKNGHDSFSVSFDKAAYKRSANNVMFQTVQQFNRTCRDGSLDKVLDQCVKNNLTVHEAALNEDFKDDVIDVAKSIIGGAGATALIKKGIELGKNGSTVAKFGIIAVGAGIAFISFVIFLRWAIYVWCRTQMKLSDWFEAQAVLLQINAENLKYRDDPQGEEHKKKVYQKQMNWVNRFRSISNKLALKMSKAENDAEKAQAEARRTKYQEDDSNDDGLF